MAAKRPHTQHSLAESKAREHKYDELSRKTSTQMDLGFDAKPPSRDDAKHLVDERKKERAQEAKPKAKTVQRKTKAPAPHTSTASKKTTRTQTRKKSGTTNTKGSKRKKTTKKQPAKKNSFTIQLSLPVFIGMVVIIALLGGSLIAWKILDTTRTSALVKEIRTSESTTVVIEPGMTARSVAKLLEEEGVVSDAKVFERYLEVNGNATRIQPGTYLFAPNLTHALIASMLMEADYGITSRIQFVVFPGFTLHEIDARLASKGLAKEGEFIEATGKVAQERGLPFTEGWFLSGTYMVEPDETMAMALATAMQDACNDALRPYLIELEQLGTTLSDTLIIASLVQRETNEVSQMSDIAKVIFNRLQADMPIGIDAALRYGLNAWDRPFTEEELDSSNPYNMRRVKGLPPTGVGAPGPASIDAAFSPSDHNWYYYIHDTEGHIHFAETYEGHLENIAKFLE